MAKEILKREYNYCSYKLDPYANHIQSSSSLLKVIINKLQDSDRPSELIEIDRYANQKGTEKRNLIHLGVRWGTAGKRCFGQMALVKDGFLYTLQGKDVVEEVQKPQNSKFVRLTHYIIDFTSEEPIMMIQFNSSGPRISDVTFYFRQISKYYKVATSIKHITHLKVDIDKLESQIRTVFEINVKVNSKKSLSIGSSQWFKDFIGLNTKVGFKDVRMEYFFRRKQNNGRYMINALGLDFARSIIAWLKNDQKNIDDLEDLSMSYELEDGSVKDFNFMKNKWTSYFIISEDNKTGLEIRKEFERQAAQELNYYLVNGKSSMEDYE
jgi:hypothetical protein